MIICPGGGHHILAYDHEGTEVAEFLAKHGVTGIVLKYRVPSRERTTLAGRPCKSAAGDPRRRSKATSGSIDPKRIGILGFSAGGETAGLATADSPTTEYYPPVDDGDSRPGPTSPY